MVDLTPEQASVLAAILAGVRFGRLVTTLGGFAGTGKTTLIGHLRHYLSGWAVCAYTGKAADVLRCKGLHDACTIHSLIYVPVKDPATRRVSFLLKPFLGHPGVIVDEASMVGSEQFQDLKSFGVPLIFVGDHGQLPPVQGTLNLMADPDHRLETIHRNAGEIARFAEHLRLGRPAATFPTEGKVTLLNRGEVTIDLACSVDQVLCAFNSTRVSTNRAIRLKEGRHDVVEIGERVICLRNNREAALFNGVQGKVTSLYRCGNEAVMDLNVRGVERTGIPYDPAVFHCEKLPRFWNQGDPNWFDHARVVTCHKFQGDESDTGLVLFQPCDLWEEARWTYTAASRFREAVYWALSRRERAAKVAMGRKASEVTVA